MSTQLILIVEDDADIVQVVREQVEDLGYSLVHADNGERGLKMALEEHYILLILDLKLPKLGGLEVCRRVRKENDTIPILILTSESEDSDIVLGLELGADDYLTKPFSIKQLRARISAVLRRVEAYKQVTVTEQGSLLVFGDFRLDLINQSLSIGGKPIELTRTEYHLLRCLASQAGRVFSREELLRDVLGYDTLGYEMSINPHISRLRAKVEVDPANPRYVLTVRGSGYRFVNAEELEG